MIQVKRYMLKIRSTSVGCLSSNLPGFPRGSQYHWLKPVYPFWDFSAHIWTNTCLLLYSLINNYLLNAFHVPGSVVGTELQQQNRDLVAMELTLDLRVSLPPSPPPLSLIVASTQLVLSVNHNHVSLRVFHTGSWIVASFFLTMVLHFIVWTSP